MLGPLVALSLVAGVCVASPIAEETLPHVEEKCGYESCTQAQAGMLNVHIVPHTHDDVGWLKTVDQYYFGSRDNIQKAGVQYILDSVIKELWEDPKRRFMYVETAFFWKWWVRQTDAVKQKVHTLVRQGRLQFVGGAWSMNDEAATHYQSTIDQFTYGLRKLNHTFGACGLPKVGWQIDPFGHSREFASLLAAMGYDGLFLGRIDYQDKMHRKDTKKMEMVWRGDDDLGKPSELFTGVLYNTYSPPPGFCFDILCSDEPIIDDFDSPMYNVDAKVSKFLEVTSNMSKAYQTNNILVTMGEDFNYQEAYRWFHNLDKLIEYTNLKAAKDELNIKLFYSTPDCYLKAVRDANPTLTTKSDDFFPYASDPHAYWTGYFTSRPTVKYFEREGNTYLQAVKQLQTLTGLEDHNSFVINELSAAMGVMQHHDAVTGTEKQHVARDYERLLTAAQEDALTVARQAFNKIMQGDALKKPLFSYDRCRLNESSCYTSETSNNFIVTLYNPLAWKLAASPVRIPVMDGHYTVVAPNGEAITTQLIKLPQPVIDIPTRHSSATHELVFLALNVKPLGIKTFYVQKKDKFKRDIKPTDKRRSEFYDSNDYFKKRKEQMYVEIKNIEDEAAGLYKSSDRLIKEERIPDQPTPLEKPDNNLNNERYMDLSILQDKKDAHSENMEELERMIKDAREKLLKQDVQTPRDDVERKVRMPNLNDEEMRMLSDDPGVVERLAEDKFLQNQNIQVRINNTTGQITHATLADGSEVPFSVQLLYYPGCSGDNSIFTRRASGAYIFRPNATEPFLLKIDNNSEIVEGPVVDEIQFKVSDYVSGTVRVYKHPSIQYIEHDWLVGPIPVDDKIGKEVVVRYTTNIVNNGQFYTDSNGRQMLKRVLNKRPEWDLVNHEPVAGNYYPVTNKIYIADDQERLTVLTDRAQGGTSLREGDVELMLHRRLLYDDGFGVGEALDERAGGKNRGLVARGTHRVFLANANDKARILNESRSVLEMHLPPLVFVSNSDDVDLTEWLTLKICFSTMKAQLPFGLHLLTLEPWHGNNLLLRLENYLQKRDAKDANVRVDLNTLFANLKLISMKETALAANRWVDEYEKWTWTVSNDLDAVETSEHPEPKGTTSEFNVVIKPKQIRTFIIEYEFVGPL